METHHYAVVLLQLLFLSPIVCIDIKPSRKALLKENLANESAKIHFKVFDDQMHIYVQEEFWISTNIDGHTFSVQNVMCLNLSL